MDPNKQEDAATADIREDGKINFTVQDVPIEKEGAFKTNFTGRDFPRFTPSLEAMKEFPGFYNRTQIPNQPIILITDPAEVRKCEQITGTTTGVFQHKYGGQALYPTFRPKMKKPEDQYGTQFENAPFASLMGLTAILVIVVITAENGKILLFLIKHFRITMSRFSEKEGGGNAFEPISSGQRKGSTVGETVESEAAKEGRLKVLGIRKLMSGYSQQPGSNGEPTEPWVVHAQLPTDGIQPTDHFEGINGSIMLSRTALDEFCRKEVYIDANGDRAKTNGLHLHSAAYLMRLFKLWDPKKLAKLLATEYKAPY